MARSVRGPFSVGAGLTIDEFALWIYLDDVYWAEEGRSSIDATVIAPIFTAAILLLLVTACFVKQRVLHGALGMFLWPIALYGAASVAKPGSP